MDQNRTDLVSLRDVIAEEAVRQFLGNWGPEIVRDAGNFTLPDFAAQCEAMLEVGPPIISSIMGLYPGDFVARMKGKGIKWFATATTVTEAKAAEDAGADVIIAQGMEAGGHRGTFDAAKAEARLIGLFSLLPAVVDAVKVPEAEIGTANANNGPKNVLRFPRGSIDAQIRRKNDRRGRL